MLPNSGDGQYGDYQEAEDGDRGRCVSRYPSPRIVDAEGAATSSKTKKKRKVAVTKVRVIR